MQNEPIYTKKFISFYNKYPLFPFRIKSQIKIENDNNNKKSYTVKKRRNVNEFILHL